MANYIPHTQQRSAVSDRSLLMSAYLKLDLEFCDEKDMAAKQNALTEMAYLTSNVLHRSVQPEVMLREGSVIVEVIASGNLSELLSLENLRAIGVSISELDMIDTAAAASATLLSYRALRAALDVLIKDIKTATATLSMYARYVFSARLGNVVRMEARTGIIGNLSRLLDACDVTRSDDISIVKRRNAMERVLAQLNAIDKLTENKEDRTLAFQYIRRELDRIPAVRLPENASAKEGRVAQDFTNAMSACKKIVGTNSRDNN